MPKAVRCSFGECNKKLSITDKLIGKCKCDNIFCNSHRIPEEHVCSFDWYTHGKQKLTDELTKCKCVSKKIEAC